MLFECCDLCFSSCVDAVFPGAGHRERCQRHRWNHVDARVVDHLWSPVRRKSDRTRRVDAFSFVGSFVGWFVGSLVREWQNNSETNTRNDCWGSSVRPHSFCRKTVSAPAEEDFVAGLAWETATQRNATQRRVVVTAAGNWCRERNHHRSQFVADSRSTDRPRPTYLPLVGLFRGLARTWPVSYTHLTLPTIYSV